REVGHAASPSPPLSPTFMPLVLHFVKKEIELELLGSLREPAAGGPGRGGAEPLRPGSSPTRAPGARARGGSRRRARTACGRASSPPHGGGGSPCAGCTGDTR